MHHPPQGGERTKEEELGEEKYPSALPFLPALTDATISQYFQFYVAMVGVIILFGGLLSPVLEVRLGIGVRASPGGAHARAPVCS